MMNPDFTIKKEIEKDITIKTIDIIEIKMPQPKKRIYNPVTDTYYEIRQRTTEYGKKGEIKGTWKKRKSK
ncbi:Uncharacterised protein [uncultured archaeon]|nr:Uncharacterised protein [uncultured archaeon]